MSAAGRIVVVGASLAGVRTAKALRRKGFDGPLAIIGEEDVLPYDRPPLSKQFLTADEPALKPLENEEFYDGVELRLGQRAVGLDRAAGAVRLADGSKVTGEHVVIATGTRARSLPLLPDGERVARLRSAADAARIRAALSSARHLLVVGGGFIGCEVAASARSLGIEVTIVEPASAPVVRGVGEWVGGVLADVHRDHGVDVRLGVSVADAELGSSGVSVVLTDGSHVETDFVVVGIGAEACTDWLDGSGVPLANGVVCDDRCRVMGGGGRIWAAGDVARWPSGTFGGDRRVEHWTNAVEQSAVLAANLLDDAADLRHDPVPYVWSDQYGHKIQIVGDVGARFETTLLQGSVAERRFAVAYSDQGVLCGVVAFDLPREVVQKRPLIASAARMADVS